MRSASLIEILSRSDVWRSPWCQANSFPSGSYLRVLAELLPHSADTTSVGFGDQCGLRVHLQ
jgi:hypothetical protein